MPRPSCEFHGRNFFYFTPYLAVRPGGCPVDQRLVLGSIHASKMLWQ
jgi:hypothetical protein